MNVTMDRSEQNRKETQEDQGQGRHGHVPSELLEQHLGGGGMDAIELALYPAIDSICENPSALLRALPTELDGGIGGHSGHQTHGGQSRTVSDGSVPPPNETPFPDLLRRILGDRSIRPRSLASRFILIPTTEPA